MAKLLLTTLVLLFSSPLSALAEAGHKWGESFSFSIQTASDDAESHPFVTLFPDNKVEDDAYTPEEVGEVLDTLRGARQLLYGTSKGDSDTGLAVMFRNIGFQYDEKTRHYVATLEGEFNAVKVDLKDEDMKKLLAGESNSLVLTGSYSRRLPGKYLIESSNTLTMRLSEAQLLIEKVDANCTITYTPLIGRKVYKYISPTIKIAPQDDADVALYGVRAPLKGLDILK